MGSPLHFRILDERGRPLNPRIEAALASLVPRLQRHFPTFRDDGALVDALEEAGRRITHREAEHGPIERLHGYAWVTLRSVATSRMRGGASRLEQRTVNSQDAAAVIGGAVATYGTPEEIERHILLREVLATLTEEERLICILKKAGFSSQEIAARRGGSAAAIDTLISRIKQKVRDNLRRQPEPRQRKMMLKATDAPRQTPAVRRPRNRGL